MPGDLAGQLGHRGLQLERLLHQPRQLQQALDVLAPVLRQQHAPPPPEPDGQQIEGDQRRGERLGRRHPDLGPRVGVERSGGLARERRPHHVGDADDGRALGAGRLDRAERVRGLARLRERDHEGLGPEDRVAVAVLRAQVHLGGDPGEALQHEAADDGRVIGRAAGHQDDSLNPGDDLGIELHVGQHHGAALRLHAPPHGVGGRARLLVDLLQHEVAVAALLGEDRIPEDARGRPLHRGAVELGDLDPAPRHHRHVLVLQHHHVAGVGQDGRDVGSQEGLVLAQAHHHAARAELGRHQPIGHLAMEHDDRVGAAQLTERAAHRLVELRSVLEMALDQMRDDLGIRLGREDVPLGLQALLDRQVVLDDAVVHHHEVAGAVGVRVRVLVGGPAVGGPARVAEADAAFDRLLAQESLQVLDAPGRAPDLQPRGADNRDARRVVAAVLEAPEPLDHGVDRVLVPDVSDDSTHGPTPSAWASCPSACAPPSPRASPAGRGPPPAPPAARSW